MKGMKGLFVARNPLKCKSHNLSACCAEEPTVVLLWVASEWQINHNKPAAIWAQKPQTGLSTSPLPFIKIQKLYDFFWFNSFQYVLANDAA